MKKILLILLTIFTLNALAYCEDFKIKNGVLESCASKASYIKIPDSVTNVGNFAFVTCENAKTIYISKNVKSCEALPYNLENIIVDEKNPYYSSQDGVLYNKNKTKIIIYPKNKKGDSFVIPDSVFIIKYYCFCNSKFLKEIYIPKKLKEIKDHFCIDNLEAINVSEENPYFKSVDGILFNKSLDTLIAYPTNKPGKYYKIPETVKSIGESAFNYNSSLTDVVIPQNVLSIGKDAFACSEIENISLCNTIKEIGSDAFYGAPSTSLTLEIVDLNNKSLDLFTDFNAPAKNLILKYKEHFIVVHQNEEEELSIQLNTTKKNKTETKEINQLLQFLFHSML